MNARPIQSNELDAYDRLAHEHGTLFDTIRWTELFGHQLNRFGIFDKGGRLRGGFCLFEERRWGVRLIRNPPYTPTFGPFFQQEGSNPVSKLGTRRRILDAVVGVLDQQRRAVVSISLDKRIDDGLPFYWDDFKVVPNYTYVLDLTQDLDAIRAGMSAGRRNDISKAERDGVVAEQTRDTGIIRELVHESFERQNKGVDPNIESILTRFASADNSYAFAATRDGDPVACSFVVHDHGTAYHLLAGYRARNKHHGAGAVAVFAAICRAKELGLHSFDFEGSVLPPIERFVRGFGGRLTPYLTINKAWLPYEIALKLVRRSTF